MVNNVGLEIEVGLRTDGWKAWCGTRSRERESATLYRERSHGTSSGVGKNAARWS